MLLALPIAIPFALGLLWMSLRGDFGLWMAIPASLGLGWTCIFWGYLWLWYAFGNEQLSIESGYLVIRREILGWRATRRFATTNVEDVRVDPPSRSWAGYEWNLVPSRSGVIAFRHGLDTVRFGSSLAEKDAQRLVAQIREALVPPSNKAVQPTRACGPRG